MHAAAMIFPEVPDAAWSPTPITTT
jgi:hypothetical protein